MDDVTTLEGWYTLHDFRRMDWSLWSKLSTSERGFIKAELFDVLGEWRSAAELEQGSFGLFEICGHKADFLFLNLRPTLEELIALERKFNKTQFAQYCTAAHSYVSVAELSTYVVNHQGGMENDPQVKARLQPKIPAFNNLCFYPMNKKRDGLDNWYMQSIENRRQMMKSHGLIGRNYAGKVLQMIGGSIGFDDYEWGVTLFADDPITFKKLVYEMRFDEVSARFAEFGPFWIGSKSSMENLSENLN